MYVSISSPVSPNVFYFISDFERNVNLKKKKMREREKRDRQTDRHTASGENIKNENRGLCIRIHYRRVKSIEHRCTLQSASLCIPKTRRKIIHASSANRMRMKLYWLLTPASLENFLSGQLKVLQII